MPAPRTSGNGGGSGIPIVVSRRSVDGVRRSMEGRRSVDHGQSRFGREEAARR